MISVTSLLPSPRWRAHTTFERGTPSVLLRHPPWSRKGLHRCLNDSLSDTLSCLFAFYLTHHVPKNTSRPCWICFTLCSHPTFCQQLLTSFCGSSASPTTRSSFMTTTARPAFLPHSRLKTRPAHGVQDHGRYQGGKDDKASRRMRAFFLELPHAPLH